MKRYLRRKIWWAPALAVGATALGVVSAATLIGQWEFDDPNNPGKATVGDDLTVFGPAPGYLDGLLDEDTMLETGVILTVQGKNNTTPRYAGGFLVNNPIGANGEGSAKTNRYTLVYDVMSPASSHNFYRSFLQTNPANSDDTDYAMHPNGTLGISALKYSSEAIQVQKWTRVVLNFDVGNKVQLYVNGQLFFTHNADTADGRFSLGPSFLLFADNDGENAPLYISKVEFYEGNLTEAEIAAMGAPGRQLPTPPLGWISGTGFEAEEFPIWPHAESNTLPVPKPDPFPLDLIYLEDGRASLPFRPQNNKGTIQVRDDDSPFGSGQYLYIDGYVGNPNRLDYASYEGDFGITHVFPTALPKHTSLSLDFSEPSSTDPNLQGPMTFGFGTNRDVGAGAYIVWQLQEGKIKEGLGGVTRQKTSLDLDSMSPLAMDHPYKMHVQLNMGERGWDVEVPGGTGNVSIDKNCAVLYVEDLATGEITYYGVWEAIKGGTVPDSFGFKSFTSGQPGNALMLDNFQVINSSLTEAGRWTGLGEDALWNTAENWEGDRLPPEEAPLFFVDGESMFEMENNLPSHSVFESLNFLGEGEDYMLSGNALDLSMGVNTAKFAWVELETDIAMRKALTLSAEAGSVLSFWGSLQGSFGLNVSAPEPEDGGIGEVNILGASSFTGPVVVDRGRVVVEGDQTASKGGWMVDTATGSIVPRTAAVVFFDADIDVAANARVQVGHSYAGYTGGNISVEGSSKVTNAATLYLGFDGTITLWDEAEWTQSGKLEFSGRWGNGAWMEVHDDAKFVYKGTSTIPMANGGNYRGRSQLILDGGTFVTSRGFVSTIRNDYPDTGEQQSLIRFKDGTMKITANIGRLNDSFIFMIIEEGDAIFDTNGYNTSIATHNTIGGTNVVGVIDEGPPGAGNLVKQGAGILTVTTEPNYTGDTVVEAGMLTLQKTGLDKGSTVFISDGAVLNLVFIGTDLVSGLEIGGVEYGPGVWDSSNTGGAITGTGKLEVIAAGSFASWAASYDLSGDPLADFDNDGLSDGLEYALAGFDPTVPNGAAGEREGTTLRFLKNPEAVANEDVAYVIQMSNDLDTWWAAPEELISEDDDQISISIAGDGMPATIFVRLQVTIAEG